MDLHDDPLFLEARPAIRIRDRNVSVEELLEFADTGISRYKCEAISEIEELFLFRRFALAEFRRKISSIEHVAMKNIAELHVSRRS